MATLQVSASFVGQCGITTSMFGWETQYTTLGNYLGERRLSVITFQNITIPKNATILSAMVYHIATYNQSNGYVKVNYHFTDADNPAHPTSVAQAQALVLTSAVSENNLSHWSIGNTYASSDVSSILQGIINRAGWVSGNRIQFVIRDNLSNNNAHRGILFGANKIYIIIEYSTELPIPQNLRNKYILENRTTIGFKLETTPGVRETLTGDNFKFQVYDVNIQPDVEHYVAKVCGMDFSRPKAIAGKRSCAVNFSIDLCEIDIDSIANPTVYEIQDGVYEFGGGVDEFLNPAQTYLDLFQACGWSLNSYGQYGASVSPSVSNNRKTMTIEVCFTEEGSSPRQLVYRVTGAMGNVKISGEVGKPIRFEFSFLGSMDWVGTRAYADILTPTSFDTTQPTALLEAEVTLFDRRLYLESFEINSNEVVNLASMINSGSGYDGSYVTDRFSTGKIKADFGIRTYPAVPDTTIPAQILEMEDGVYELEDGVYTT